MPAQSAAYPRSEWPDVCAFGWLDRFCGDKETCTATLSGKCMKKKITLVQRNGEARLCVDDAESIIHAMLAEYMPAFLVCSPRSATYALYAQLDRRCGQWPYALVAVIGVALVRRQCWDKVPSKVKSNSPAGLMHDFERLLCTRGR